MAKTISLNFIAHDYQRVADIKLLNYSEIKINGAKKDQQQQQKENYIDSLLLDSLEKLDKMDDSSLYIGCSDVRKKRKEKISVFMSSGAHTKDSLINGIIGAATVIVDNKKYNGMNIGGKFEKIKVNIQFESRYDSAYRNLMDSHLVIGKDAAPDPKTKSYFAATLLTHGEIDNFNDSVYCSNNALFDFLLVDILFKQIKEANPKGLFRTYRRFEKNDDRLKGTIDISRHIRLNAGQNNGKVAYSKQLFKYSYIKSI